MLYLDEYADGCKILKGAYWYPFCLGGSTGRGVHPTKWTCPPKINPTSWCIFRVGQNRIYTPYVIICIVISKIPCIHRIYLQIHGSGQSYVCIIRLQEFTLHKVMYTVACERFWPTQIIWRVLFNTSQNVFAIYSFCSCQYLHCISHNQVYLNCGKQAHTHTHTHTRARTHRQANTHAHVRVQNLHTHTHTHKHTHTHTHLQHLALHSSSPC